MAKFFMDVYCDGQKEVVQKLNGQRVVLRNNKVPWTVPPPELFFRSWITTFDANGGTCTSGIS